MLAATASAQAHAHLERPRHFAQTCAQRGQINVLGGHQRLQREALQDGGEEEEELHACQRLTHAQSAPCGVGEWGEVVRPGVKGCTQILRGKLI